MIIKSDIDFAEEFGNVWLDGSLTAKTVLATRAASHREQATRELIDLLEEAKRMLANTTWYPVDDVRIPFLHDALEKTADDTMRLVRKIEDLIKATTDAR